MMEYVDKLKADCKYWKADYQAAEDRARALKRQLVACERALQEAEHKTKLRDEYWMYRIDKAELELMRFGRVYCYYCKRYQADNNVVFEGNEVRCAHGETKTQSFRDHIKVKRIYHAPQKMADALHRATESIKTHITTWRDKKHDE